MGDLWRCHVDKQCGKGTKISTSPPGGRVSKDGAKLIGFSIEMFVEKIYLGPHRKSKWNNLDCFDFFCKKVIRNDNHPLATP